MSILRLSLLISALAISALAVTFGAFLIKDSMQLHSSAEAAHERDR